MLAAAVFRRLAQTQFQPETGVTVALDMTLVPFLGLLLLTLVWLLAALEDKEEPRLGQGLTVVAMGPLMVAQEAAWQTQAAAVVEQLLAAHPEAAALG